MPYNSAGTGSQIPVARIKPITADFIGDATAGGNTNLQTYLDDRRNYRGKVANVSGLSAISSPQNGDLVLVVDNGAGKSDLRVYQSSSTSWVTASSDVLSSANTFTGTNTFSNKVTLPTAISNVVATNLVTNSDGALATYTNGGPVTAATTALTGFTNSVQYGDNTVTRYAYKAITFTTGVTYTFSAYVQMDDNSVPVPGTQNSAHDFTIVMAGGIRSTASNCTVTLVSGSLYRVSVAWTSTTTGSANSGLVKYTQNSAKPFRIAGYQIEVGSVATDFILTGASAVTRNEFEATGLLKASSGLTVSAGTITFPAASVGDSALSSNVALLTGTQTFSGAKTFSSGLTVTGTASATTFSGSGASLTALNATNLSTGTVADARLSSNVVLLSGSQTLTGAKTFSGGVTLSAGTLTLATDPTAALQAATKQYVDNLISGYTRVTLFAIGDVAVFVGAEQVDYFIIPAAFSLSKIRVSSPSVPASASKTLTVQVFKVTPSSGSANLSSGTQIGSDINLTTSSAAGGLLFVNTTLGTPVSLAADDVVFIKVTACAAGFTDLRVELI